MTWGEIWLVFQIVVEFWWLWCLRKMLKQKKAHLQAVSMCAKAAAKSGTNDYKKYYEIYDRVGFWKHLFYIFTFRDPAKLYERE